jgi:hypothetical protein
LQIDHQQPRLELLERGFSLVQTPAFFDQDLLVHFKRKRTTLRPMCKRWWRVPQLARYACWLERLLGRAVPEETLSLASLEFRHEPAGFQDPNVDHWHADGSYLRTVCTLYGLPTLYLDGDVERSLPEGHTLLMTAQDRTRALRVPCTLHRRPGAGPARAVIVCSFEPSQAQPHLAAIHRLVEQQSPGAGGRIVARR